MDTLLDSAALSEALKVPVRTLDQWAYVGKGPAYVRVGRHRRYRQADVNRWLDEQTRGGPDVPAA
jgi:excisionase family DNA binding protein